MNTETIEDIILEYCEGRTHLEFNYDDMGEILDRIKKLVEEVVIDDAEHLDDARGNIKYL